MIELKSHHQLREHQADTKHSAGMPLRERTIFSAYEVGKTARTAAQLQQLSGGREVVLDESTPTTAVHEIYQNEPGADFLPIQNEAGRITGYIRRQMFFAALSQNQFTRDLLLKPGMTVAGIMDPRVVCLDAFTRLPEASEALMRRDEEVRFDPFVVTHEGEFYGISSVRRVLDALNFYFKQDLLACDDAQRSVMRSAAFMGAAADSILRAETRVQPLTGPGGDYAAVFDLNERLSLMVLFDVCGKGLKAAQMVTTIATALRTMLEFDSQRRTAGLGQFDLTGKLAHLNRIVYETTPEEMYATGVVLLFDRLRKVVQVFDFGHSLVWLRRKHRIHNLCDDLEFDSTVGVPFFGIDADLRVAPRNFQLRAGDCLFVCSDGVTEARNREREEFGVDAIMESLLAAETSSPDAVLDTVEASWLEFRAGYRQLDDVSMLAAVIGGSEKRS